jgi:hypothetical protein
MHRFCARAAEAGFSGDEESDEGAEEETDENEGFSDGKDDIKREEHGSKAGTGASRANQTSVANAVAGASGADSNFAWPESSTPTGLNATNSTETEKDMAGSAEEALCVQLLSWLMRRRDAGLLPRPDTSVKSPPSSLVTQSSSLSTTYPSSVVAVPSLASHGLDLPAVHLRLRQGAYSTPSAFAADMRRALSVAAAAAAAAANRTKPGHARRRGAAGRLLRAFETACQELGLVAGGGSRGGGGEWPAGYATLLRRLASSKSTAAADMGEPAALVREGQDANSSSASQNMTLLSGPLGVASAAAIGPAVSAETLHSATAPKTAGNAIPAPAAGSETVASRSVGLANIDGSSTRIKLGSDARSASASANNQTLLSPNGSAIAPGQTDRKGSVAGTLASALARLEAGEFSSPVGLVAHLRAGILAAARESARPKISRAAARRVLALYETHARRLAAADEAATAAAAAASANARSRPVRAEGSGKWLCPHHRCAVTGRTASDCGGLLFR